MQGITVAAFAKIKNVSPTAVHKAIADGRLVNCLLRDPRYKKPRLDPVVAAQEWERNTDHSKRHSGADIRVAPPAPAPHSKNIDGSQVSPTAKQVMDGYKARLLKLEYDKKAGLLVDAAAIEGEWFKIITEAKTKIMALPSKAKAALPQLKPAEVATIDRLVREILMDLANGNG